MIFMLRDKFNRTLIDIETLNGKEGLDLRVAVDLDIYTRNLLGTEVQRTIYVTNMCELSDLRGYWFERHLPSLDFTPTEQYLDQWVRDLLTYVIEKLPDYKLHLSED